MLEKRRSILVDMLGIEKISLTIGLIEGTPYRGPSTTTLKSPLAALGALKTEPGSPGSVAAAESVSVITVVSVGVGECEAALPGIDD